MSIRNCLILGAATLLSATAPAFAHLDPVEHGSFAAGFSHPLFGMDHVLAMVAVGLWAALLGGRALWSVPAAFVTMMSVGFAAALIGAPLPFVEPVILASVIIIGLAAAAALRVSTAAAMGLVACFAFFHGHAHGGELGDAGACAFMVGFAVATALLHSAGVLLGLGVGRLFSRQLGQTITRTVGGLTAVAGLWLAVGA